MQGVTMAKLLIPISEGFEEIETITLIDVCRRGEIDVKIAAIKSIETTGSHNITIKADILIDEVKSDDFDMIILPGGLPNAYNLAENEKVLAFLQEMRQKEKLIGAICAAPYALHKAGVLNKNYTCYPSFEQKIGLEGYREDSDFVIDGKVITSRGPGTAMTFALEVVKLLSGEAKYKTVKLGLLAT